MFIYCLELHIGLPAFSLKEKRGIVKSILLRARNRFNVASAEIGSQESHRFAELGFVSVSGDRNIARKTVAEVENWICENWPEIGIRGSSINEV